MSRNTPIRRDCRGCGKEFVDGTVGEKLNNRFCPTCRNVYQQGRTDRDREIAESNVFFSNRPIEDIVLETIDDERERIIKELGKIEREVEYMNQFDVGFNSAINKAIEKVRGGDNEFY